MSFLWRFVATQVSLEADLGHVIIAEAIIRHAGLTKQAATACCRCLEPLNHLPQAIIALYLLLYEWLGADGLILEGSRS